MSQEDVELARVEWAKTFVDRCIEVGLGAVAITDHHEMVMVRYVSAEIGRRKTIDPAFDLWLFPGMELTTSGGAQSLILFDAELEEKWWLQAQGELGIAHASINVNAKQGLPVTQLSLLYPDLAEKLDRHEALKGHYIILPNVSEGGQHTVLKNGAGPDFKRMPYVGGYLDKNQTIETLGAKAKARLSGDDKNWSARAIYPMPTTDSREEGYPRLGENSAWIKLAAPTAEAIRQAFLSCQSRIRISRPCLPSIGIEEIEISNSSIIADGKIFLSRELNSVIGGRGSGKSSFLEYVAFILGRSCYDVEREKYSSSDRMKSLIVDTLISRGGRISAAIRQDEATFFISRGPENAYQPSIKYPNGEQQIVSTKELRSLFPAVVYSQGELSEIGKSTALSTDISDLLQFVKPDYKRQADELERQIESAQQDARKSAQRVVERWELEARTSRLRNQQNALRERISALEKTLPQLSEDDQKTLSRYEIVSRVDDARVQASKHVLATTTALTSVLGSVGAVKDWGADLPVEAQEVYSAYTDFYQTAFAELERLNNLLRTKAIGYTDVEKKWIEIYNTAKKAKDSALEKLSAHRNATAQIKDLQAELKKVTELRSDVEGELIRHDEASKNLTSAVEKIKELSEIRANKVQEWAQEIETLSSGKIRAEISREGDISNIRDAIDIVAAKTGSQESTRYRQLDALIAAHGNWGTLDRLRNDALSIIRWRHVGAVNAEEKPKCEDLVTTLGGTERITATLFEVLDVPRIEALCSAAPNPDLSFFYCDGGREISFEKASEGQRAAGLLFMLLQQEGGPLIVDQPEGDLDNKVISELTDILHKAKQNRQLIFASHNANMVVNGSSELVGHMDTNADGVRNFDCSGAIDKPDVCGLITSTMEGGEKAFKDRQKKYGY